MLDNVNRPACWKKTSLPAGPTRSGRAWQGMPLKLCPLGVSQMQWAAVSTVWQPTSVAEHSPSLLHNPAVGWRLSRTPWVILPSIRFGDWALRGRERHSSRTGRAERLRMRVPPAPDYRRRRYSVSMTAQSSPHSSYQERRDTFAAEEKRLAGISFRFSLFRGALFLAFVVCLAVILVRGGRPGWGWWAGSGFWLVAFVGVLPRHDRIIQGQHRFAELRKINEEGLLRLVRSWESLPLPTLPEPGESGRAVARDLNLFGRASLAQLLGTAHTPPGKGLLAIWLLRPALPVEIARRQAAVAELAPEIDLRQQLEVGVRPMEKSAPDLEPFLDWAEDKPWLLDRPWLIWLARLLAVATTAALLLSMGAILPVQIFVILATVNIVLGYRFRERTHGTFNRIEAPEGDFQLYADALERIAGHSYAADELHRIAGDLTVEGHSAHHWMLLLHRRVELSHVRHSSYLYFILQSLLCWDLNILVLLERWQQEAGARVRGWLAALGRFEALAALA